MPSGLLSSIILSVNNFMLKKIKLFLNYLLLLLLSGLIGLEARAGVLKPDVPKSMTDQNTNFNNAAGYENVDQTGLANMIGIVIQAFLSLLGVILIALIIYGGYTWMMARGNEEKVQKAKDTLMRAIIGLVITAAAYAIAAFVSWRLRKS